MTSQETVPQTDLDLSEIDRCYNFHPFTALAEHEKHGPPVVMVRGDGVWLEDATGQRYIDGMAVVVRKRRLRSTRNCRSNATAGGNALVLPCIFIDEQRCAGVAGQATHRNGAFTHVENLFRQLRI